MSSTDAECAAVLAFLRRAKSAVSESDVAAGTGLDVASVGSWLWRAFSFLYKSSLAFVLVRGTASQDSLPTACGSARSPDMGPLLTETMADLGTSRDIDQHGEVTTDMTRLRIEAQAVEEQALKEQSSSNVVYMTHPSPGQPSPGGSRKKR